jgi:pSer/pThr/pTyr-binding forkhead associated (FHA) protein
MPITVIVRSMAGDEPRLTFDGTQRVVIGRGVGSDVRVPDASVSHRHATLRSQGSEFVVVDEGSTNGTFVGDVRVAARMSRMVRSGDWVRVGRVWLRVLIDQSPATRDLALATRDLALVFVARALEARGVDRTTVVRVVEGPDQGLTLALEEKGRGYVVGRGAHCDLPLLDADSSREHARIVRTDAAVLVEDLGAKNGTWLGGTRLLNEQPSAWRPAQMLKVGRTVLGLQEPVADALAEIERAEDEVLGPDDIASAPSVPGEKPALKGSGAPDLAAVPASARESPLEKPTKTSAWRWRGRWSVLDLLVMGAALGVLALSLMGMLWLLRGVAVPTTR